MVLLEGTLTFILPLGFALRELYLLNRPQPPERRDPAPVPTPVPPSLDAAPAPRPRVRVLEDA
jgi:hypothetical protein